MSELTFSPLVMIYEGLGEDSETVDRKRMDLVSSK